MRNLIALAVGAVLASAGAAFAQDTTVSLGPWVEFVLPIILTVITAVIGPLLIWAITKWTEKTGLVIEQQKRDALQTALTNAAAGLIHDLGEKAKELTIEVRNPRLAAAVNRAIKGAPDAFKWTGLTQDEIARRVLEQVTRITNGKV